MARPAPPSTSERWLARSSTRESPSAAASTIANVTTAKRAASPLPARTSTTRRRRRGRRTRRGPTDTPSRSSRRAGRPGAGGRPRSWRSSTASQVSSERRAAAPPPRGSGAATNAHAGRGDDDNGHHRERAERGQHLGDVLDHRGRRSARRCRRRAGRPGAASRSSSRSASRKKTNEPTAPAASSVVTSRPKSPGVRRFQTKRAGPLGDARRRAHDPLPGRPQRRRDRAQQRLLQLRVDPPRGPRPQLRVALEPDEEDDPDDQRDDEAEREQAARDPRRELVERAPEDEAEDAERRRPQAGAEDVVGQELAQRHVRRAGDERRDRAHEADEAADQDRHPAAALEEALDLLEALLGDLHAGAVADHEVAAEPAAEHVGREVAGDGAGPDDRDQDGQRDLALAGDEAADDHRRLPRRDQPDERAGLEEGEDADGEVGPLAERLAGLLDQVLDVRAARSRPRRSGPRRARRARRATSVTRPCGGGGRPGRARARRRRRARRGASDRLRRPRTRGRPARRRPRRDGARRASRRRPARARARRRR